MTMVWDNYPAGGSELLLALALADIGRDDGTSIYPSVRTMASKTRLSERSIQYLLDKMRTSGFLGVVEQGGMAGKKKRATEYRINLSRLEQRVQDLHPSSELVDNSAIFVDNSAISVDKVIPMGANGDTDGCKRQQQWVQPVAPHTLLIIKEPLPQTRNPEIEGQSQNRRGCGKCKKPLTKGFTQMAVGDVCPKCWTAYLAGAWQTERA